MFGKRNDDMSRSTQIIGLTQEAENFIAENCARKEIKVCSECGTQTGGDYIYNIYDNKTGKKLGLFNDGPDLYEYTLKNGDKVRTIVQWCLWSSGPSIFLCLKNEKGEMLFEWTESEIDSLQWTESEIDSLL